MKKSFTFLLSLAMMFCLTISCSKDNSVTPDNPIKLLPTAFREGYVAQQVQDPSNIYFDFTALPSIAQGSDYDMYACQISLSRDFANILNSYNIQIYASKPRDVTNAIAQVHRQSSNVLYWRVRRVSDNKMSEVRQVTLKW